MKIVFILSILFSFSVLAQRSPDITEMDINDYEIRSLLEDARNIICINEFYKEKPFDIKVKRRIVTTDYIESRYFQLLADTYYHQSGNYKKQIKMIIRQDNLVHADKEIHLKCTVEK